MSKKFFLSLGLCSALILAACEREATSPAVGSAASNIAPAERGVVPTATVALDVYKSESCGCCGVWVDHAEANNFSVTAHHPDDLNATKQEYGVAARYQSCHTSVTSDGYVFEGHVPAKYIHRFLSEKPESAIGLGVPGMPMGSPGMEVGGRFRPYDVLLLKQDGSSEVYATMQTADAQY